MKSDMRVHKQRPTCSMNMPTEFRKQSQLQFSRLLDNSSVNPRNRIEGIYVFTKQAILGHIAKEYRENHGHTVSI